METNSREFEQIYSDYQPKVHRYLSRLVGAKEAEDLTQEVFLKVSKALSVFEMVHNCQHGFIRLLLTQRLIESGWLVLNKQIIII